MGLFWADTVEEDEELSHTRRLVAIHESGHAVACDVFGIPYSDIHVSVSRTYWTGQLRYQGYVMTQLSDYPEGKKALTEYATMCLAGMEAEALFLMEQGWRKGKARSFAEDHAGTDLKCAQEAVGKYGMHAVERAARGLVGSHWKSVLRLAGQL